LRNATGAAELEGFNDVVGRSGVRVNVGGRLDGRVWSGRRLRFRGFLFRLGGSRGNGFEWVRLTWRRRLLLRRLCRLRRSLPLGLRRRGLRVK